MRAEAFRQYGKLKGLALVFEDAFRMYLASRPATYTDIMILTKSTKKKIDYLIAFLKDPEKAQVQYKLDELKELIGSLLQVEDERTKIKYLKSLVAQKILEIHPGNEYIITNKVYPLPQESQYYLDSLKKNVDQHPIVSKSTSLAKEPIIEEFRPAFDMLAKQLSKEAGDHNG